MNKKFYTAPNVDIVELQGEVVLTNVSNVMMLQILVVACHWIQITCVLLTTTESFSLAHISTYGRMNDRSVSS